MRFKRPKFKASLGEQLEDRSMLSGTPLDLDLSAVPAQTVFAGETLSFNLGELGATVSEGEDGPRTVMYQLDPDGDERPEGMSMTFSGDFQWTPTAEQEGLYSVKIIAVENGKPSSADVEELMIDVRVGRPVVDLNGEDQEGIDYDAVFQVGHGPVSVVDSDLTVSDENDEMLQSAKVTLTNPMDGAEESLSIDVEGTNISVEYADGSILLSGEDTAENYANVLKTLTYNNTNADADPTSRLVEITVSDGEYESAVATSTIAVNHAPDLLPIADQAVEIGQVEEFVISATDKNESDEIYMLLDVETPEYVSLTQEAGSREATLSIAPGEGVEPGEYTIRILAVDQYGLADAQYFTLTVSEAANTAPTISPVEDQTIDQDTAAGPLAFSIGDAEMATEDLTVSVESDNEALVDAASIVMTGDGADRELVVTPLAGMTGSANITISVTDGELTTTESFLLTVNEVVAENSAPTISPIDDMAIDQDSATDPLIFTVGDAETAVEDLVASVESDNPALVDAAGILVAGDGADKSLVITPLAGATGSATITISVTDGELTTTESFVLTVNEVVAGNSVPTVSAVEDQTIQQDSATEPLAFVVGDVETAAEDLVVSVESDNPALVDAAGIIVAGDGADKTLIVTPLAGATGSANITISVTDGELVTTESFLLTVNEVVAGPTAEADSFATDANSPMSIEAAGVLANDVGDALVVSEVNSDAANVGAAVELASGATIVINADGSLSFDPSGKYEALAEGETATETVSYTTADSAAASASANVEISIAGVNDAPVAADDAFATESDTALTLTVAGVLMNDSDVDNGDTMTVSAVNGEAANVGTPVALDGGGMLTLNADGSMTFDPNGEFEGLTEPATVQFGYTVSDALGLTADATVTITVSAPSGVENENAAPINSVPGEQATDSATPIVFDEANGNAISVSDPDAADAMVQVTISVDSGVLTLSNGFESDRHKLLGSIDQINSLLTGLVYTPDSAFEGNATLTIVTDDLGNTGFGGAKADADSILIAVSAAALTGVEGQPEGEGIDVIAEDEEEVDDLFNPCDIA